jgi:hypothetical protein
MWAARFVLFVWYVLLLREVTRLFMYLSGELPYGGFWTWEIRFTPMNLEQYYGADLLWIPLCLFWIAVGRASIRLAKKAREATDGR